MSYFSEKVLKNNGNLWYNVNKIRIKEHRRHTLSYHFDPINGNMNDLNPRGYGYGQCQAGSAFSTSSESFNLVYYVEDGYGTLEKNGRIYTVNAGEAFVILSGEAAHCKADDKEPWFLRAVGFDGELGGDFSVLPDVFSADSLFFSEISKLSNDSVKKTSLLTSLPENR